MARIWNHSTKLMTGKHKQINPHTKIFGVGVNTPLKKKVFVGMSGGVDSSVAAALLSARGGSAFGGKKQKYDVSGVYIKSFNIDGCSARDAEDARRVAEMLKIPFYIFDLEKEYKEKVVKYMIDGYRRGITPNPDVMCNKEIKFGLFLKKALEMGADYVATGHYVRLLQRKNSVSSTRFAHPANRSLVLATSPLGLEIKRADRAEAAAGVSENRIFSLYQAKDLNKDQSYFLWTLTQNQLKHCLFPIGDYLKPEVRKLAKKFNLPTADKKDSQGICFLGKVGLQDFLSRYLKPQKGIILDTSGKIIGKHNGAYFYTIGQRHGLNLGNREKGAESKPYYVAEKDVESNVVLVAKGENNPVLYIKKIKLTDINWINPVLNENLFGKKLKVLMRVRYRQPLFKAMLFFSKNNGKSLRQSALKSAPVSVVFDKPQKFVAPGQSAVFYNAKGILFGGGVII